MKTVKTLLEKKGSSVFTIDREATVFDAIAEMDAHNVGALIVTCKEDNKDKVCGIISERDYLRHVILKGRSSRSTPVQEIMTRKVIYAEPSSTVEEILNIMTEQRFRHMPVMAGERLAGIVSIGDCVKAIIKQQKVEIHYLKDYIADNYPGPTSGAP
jgi:CBS domain-containing protein